MCCDAHTQGSRVKVVPLILYCASLWGYRVYNCIFYVSSSQHWEEGLHLFSYSSSVSFWFFLNPITVKVFFKRMQALFPLLPKCKTEVLEKRQVLYSLRSTEYAVERNRVSWSLLLYAVRGHTLSLLVHCCRETAWLKLWRQVWIVLL